MTFNTSKQLSQTFIGSLVHSENTHVIETSVSIIPLNNLLVKVSFQLEEQEIMFRAMLSNQREGVLMLIQDRVTDKYILSGQSGFMYKKPNIHGGFVNQLNSFYFHLRIEYYRGKKVEVYFLGKDADDRIAYLENKEFHMTISA